MKYTESHEWIKVEGEIGIVGITSYAQKELGEVVYLELPQVGKVVKGGEEIAVLESTKAAADIYSPVSGEIIATNDSLKQNVDQVNKAPESEGWLYKIKLSHPAELEALLERLQYLSLFK